MKVKELLKNLINSEDYAGRIYEEIAQKSKDEIAKTALSFAKQEDSHSKRIEALLNHLEKPDTVIPDEIAILPQLISATEELNGESLEFATRKKLFLYALQMEKDSILLYEEIANLFNEGTEEKQVFIQLIAEERKHMYFILMRLHELK